MAVHKDLSGWEQIDELAGIIGERAALRLSERFGGRRRYIKKHFPDLDPIVQAIGREAADKLSEFYGGRDPITFPSKPGKYAAIYRLRDAGKLTVSEIAETLEKSERAIYLALARREKLTKLANAANDKGVSLMQLAEANGLPKRELVRLEYDQKQLRLNLFS